MGNDLSIVLKYIKSYKARSVAIILSIVLATALIVGVGTLSRSAQQADLDRLKRETGTSHVYFKDISKKQLDTIKKRDDISSLSTTSYYASTDVGEKLPINILKASENYLTKDTKLLKGRFPENKNEIVVEEWVLNSMGLEPNVNQEITFNLYKKDKPEKFKVVGVLKDRYQEKSLGRCEAFLGQENSNEDKYTAYVEFKKGSNINKNINEITNEAKLNKKEQVRPNLMLIESIQKNGTIDTSSKTTAIALSCFAGLVIYSIFTISIYQRIREYGVLRALGCTNLKIFKFVFGELLMLSFIAIPIGIVLGMGGAQIFNKLAGNIQFEGNIKETPFVIPRNIILLAICCTILVIFVISILTFIKIKRISPIESIRRNFGSDKKVKRSRLLTSRLFKNMYITKYISLKNIFRNKKGFIMIILSMSIGGIMVINTNYQMSGEEKRIEKIDRQTCFNGDFILTVNGAIDEENGLSKEQLKEIKNIKGVKNVEAAKILNTRMPIEKSKILDMEFFENQSKSGGYFGEVLNGLIIDDKKNNEYLLKQKLKGYNTEMLKKLNKYLVSGEINIDKMKKENLAVVYVPHSYKKFEGYRDVGDHTYGKPIVDIKVGDTVKVKYPKGKIDTEKYWKGIGDYDFIEKSFKVGAIVDYPFADDNMYSGNCGVDVIVSDSNLKDMTGLGNYDLVYVNQEKGFDHKKINQELGKIGSKVSGTTTTDMTKEKEDNQKMNQKIMLYNYGIIAVMFTISIFNIINNVSYSLTSRTSEFGMLRAVGISEEKFKNMIIFEGLLYGIVSSLIVIIVGVLLQLHIYNAFRFESLGMNFKILYVDYILITLTNIAIGLLSTYFPARKIKKISIVESINIIE